MADYVMALDAGTTSCRAILFDAKGTPRAIAQREFTQYFPQPGWVEHDADEIWAAQLGTIRDCLAKQRCSARDVAAIGITNQRETILLWDRATARPLAPAIVWQDRRTAAQCAALGARGHAEEIASLTGLPLDPYFSGTKLAWLLDELPGARQRAERGELCAGTIDSWLAYRLTGGTAHITDVTNASRTMLFGLSDVDWNPRLLELLCIPRQCLPRVVASSFGGIEAQIDGTAVPLTGIAGDQQAALFGQACFKPGMAKNTYGTGCFMLMNTGAKPLRSRHRLVTTIAWERAAREFAAREFAMEGSVFIGGAVVQWLRDGLGIIKSSADIEPLARSVPDNGGVYFVPAFTGLGSPHWDPHARGTIIGITRGTTAGHIARAALESIAYQVAEVLDAMRQDATTPPYELRVDGGAAANDFLMQVQADVLGVPVVRPKVTETTALGAAYLAGLGVGFWKSEAEVAANWQIDRRFEPDTGNDQIAAQRADWARAVQRASSWAQ